MGSNKNLLLGRAFPVALLRPIFAQDILFLLLLGRRKDNAD